MYNIFALSQKVKHFRKQQNLTQLDLARLMKTSQSNISNLENGNNKFNIQKLSKIADILNVSLDDLLQDSLVSYQNKKDFSSFYDEQLNYITYHFNRNELLKTLSFLEDFIELNNTKEKKEDREY